MVTMMNTKRTWMVLIASAAVMGLGCGGGKAGDAKSPTGGGTSTVGSDLDVDDGGDAGVPEVDAAPEIDAPPPPPVVFRLTNTAKEDLVFSMDKGWQPVIFAYSGKPPKAKPILMFAKHCTAACDLEDPEGICPYCPEPEKVKDIKAAEKREVVAPGATLEVPWDAQIHVYKKTKSTRDGRKVKCDCFEKEEVPPETYTVRACGLRVTQSATASTKYQCVEGTMVFPAPDEGSQVVELTFPTAK